IDATPIASFDNRDPSKVRFGNLEFRGGLALESRHPAFGGISGINVEPGGNRFIAVTDKGSWLHGRIIYRDGRPAAIADAEMAPILGQDGRPLAARGWYDTESLAERDGFLYVGIERVEQVVRFDYRRDGLLARGQPISVTADFKTLTYNKSLECVAAPQQGPVAGELIAVSEHSLDAAGNLRSFVLGTNRVMRFSVKRTDEFDVSDCTILPPDDLLLLERRLSPVRGIAIRIRRVPLSSLKEGAVVDGRQWSKLISPIRSTTWKEFPSTARPAFKQSSLLYRTTISPFSSAICFCSLRWWRNRRPSRHHGAKMCVPSMRQAGHCRSLALKKTYQPAWAAKRFFMIC